MRSREDWVGNADRSGILQRIGIAAFIISIALVYLSLGVPGDVSIRYAILVAAHVLIYGGFVVAALSDYVAKRRFSAMRLLYTVTVGLAYGIIGPVVTPAAVGATRR
jgi:hypothetical protein